MKNHTFFSSSRICKILYLLFFMFILSISGFSQNVGINDTGNPPNPSAGLDVNFTNKGLLIPRIALSSTASFAPLSAHVAGMIVYNTATTADVTPGFYYDNGTNWVSGFPIGNAAGDMLYWNGSSWLFIAPGLPGQFLQYTSLNVPKWAGAAFATLSTTAATAITSVAATSGGNITSDGGSSILSRGVCWSILPNPTIANSKTNDGAGIGTFSSNLTGLLSGTTYYIRAYATNSYITTYGNTVTLTTQASIPILAATTAASMITGLSANSGGNVTSDGGSAIIERGICFATSSNPTIANTKVVDALPGIGSYISNITGLLGGTTYYVRAYATNGVGTAYGTQISFKTLVIPPTLTTSIATSIVGGSAVSGGTMVWNGGGYSNYQYYGVEYSINSDFTNPTTKVNTNSTNGSVNPLVNIAPWVTNLTGLTSGTTYYIRSFLYLYNAGWSYTYGDVKQFTTTAPSAPLMSTTTVITNITASTATSGGSIFSDNGSAITVKGVCWSTSPTPTLGVDNFTLNGTGSGAYISNITGLLGSTMYYVRSYATNSVGTSYGPEQTFTTCTTPAFNIGDHAGGGIVFYVNCDGSGLIAADADQSASVMWGCSGTAMFTPATLGSGAANTTTILNGCVTRPIAASVAHDYNGGGYSDWYLPSSAELYQMMLQHTMLNIGGQYWSSTDGNSPLYASIYYYLSNIQASSATKNTSLLRVRAIRSFGPAILPVVTTAAITNITGTAATSGGDVTNDGGGNVTAGVCWSTHQTPTIADFKTVDATASGPFVSNLTSLINGTTYYVRAYATNIVGTAYGAEVSFVPSGSSIPVLTTTAISNPTSTGATTGGNITSDGGTPVTARGVCWSDVNSQPTIADSKTIDGSGTGVFISNLTGLIVGNNYWIRAYATNSVGTAYGSVQFYVPQGIPVIQTLPLSYTSPATTGTSGIYILDYAGQITLANGIVWGTSPNPTVISHTGITTDPLTSNYITSTLTGLQQGITYYVRAYLTYDTLTVYGSEFNFTPGTPSLASVTTDQVINKVGSFAEVSASLLSDGGDPGAISGICWSESSNPTVGTNLGITIDGYSGQFFSQLTGLTVGTTYHVRAYATNSQGTAYGSDISFIATAAFVGQVIQGGNIYGNVFSVDGTGAHGLIADSWGFGTSDWGCTSSVTGASGTTVGTGAANTTAILTDISTNGCISVNSAFAAEMTQWMGLEWYLPSKDEFNLLWSNRVAAGIDATISTAFPFWSSTEVNATQAWYFDGTSWINTGLKTDSYTTWPIRSF